MSSVTKICAISCCIFLSACSILKPIQTEPVNTYTIDADDCVTNNHHQHHTNKTLLVSKMSTAPGYKTNAILYSTFPHELNAYTKNKWVAPPAQLLHDMLVTRLDNTHHFKAVLSPPFAGLSTYRLDTKLLNLKQIFYQNHSVVTLSIRAIFINNTQNKVIASETFQIRVPVYGHTPYAGVKAANVASSRVIEQITGFVIRNLNHKPSNKPHHI